MVGEQIKLIIHTDYDFKWNKWNDAIIDHHPSGMKFIGCGTNNKYHNLKVALETMVKVIQCKEKK
jgi:hypothetical protein